MAIVAAIGGIVFYMTQSSDNDSVAMDCLDCVQFSKINHTNITDTSVVIIGTTDIPAFCDLEWGEIGEDTMFASDRDVNPEPHTEHEIVLLDLKPSTQYIYQFSAENNGQVSWSDPRAFFTDRNQFEN